MKVTFSRLIIGVIVVTITVLGLLRYRPWSNSGVASAREVIHEGSNKKATRELTVGFLPVPVTLLVLLLIMHPRQHRRIQISIRVYSPIFRQ